MNKILNHNYQLIKQLGLEIIEVTDSRVPVVTAQDLEKLLEDAPKLFGCFHDYKVYGNRGWGFDQSDERDMTTHRCIAVGITLLKHKKVKLDEILEFINQSPKSQSAKDLKNRIMALGIEE